VRIPKPVLVGLAIIGAALLGWTFRASASSPGGPLSSQVASIDTAKQPPQAGTSSNAGTGPSAKPANVTIVLGDSPTASGGGSGSDDWRDQAVSARRSLDPTELSSSSAQTVGALLAAWLGQAGAHGAAGPTDIVAPEQMQGLSIVANGDHIVIANDGAIVSVGDNTVVKGITGDASSSGSIALDVSDSELSTGSSGLSARPQSTTRPDEGAPTTAAAATGSQGSSSGPTSGATTAARPGGTATCQAVATAGGSAGSTTSRAIAYAGYELHSIDVAGGYNFVTYDDSNLFYDRVGTLNGNTGDTDTSGLNVVDSTRSIVRTGDSGNSDETPDPPPFDPSTSGARSPVGSCPSTSGTGSASVTDVNGITTASGQDTFVVGGDGFDDNGVRVHGDHNVATYDDGNVAIGGIGDVNAQIGDSDTSGAVVMAVIDSYIRSGGSFLPASQQAGAQVGDPFDGDDQG